MSRLILFRGEMSLRKSLDSIHVAVLLLVLIHANGIDSVRTLSQASKYRITQTNGKPSNLILKCAARVVDEDIGYKVNTETGECSTGDSNNPEQGFTYFDKTDMLQRFVHDGVPNTSEKYPVRIQGGFGYNKGATLKFKLVSGWERPSINFATADCCMVCPRVVLHFLLDVIGTETGCHYKNGDDWMYGSEVHNGDQNYPTDTEITLDFKFEQSSIKVSKNGAVYLSCPHELNPEDVVYICTKGVVAIELHFYTI